MVFFRWFVGLPVAAVITAGLFAMMAGLIAQDDIDLPPPTPYPDVDIFAPDPGPPEPPIKKLKPDLKDAPEPVLKKTTRQPKPGPQPVRPNPKPVEPNPRGNGAMSGAVIRIAPLYPESCQPHGAEGTVTVQFDVTPEGNVVNVQILDSAHRCFDRTVRKTVLKWKYAPATRDGRAVMRYGVTEVIRFNLED